MAVVDYVEQGIRVFIQVWMYFVWGVVGFIFWLPLLSRTVAMYSFAMVSVSVSGGSLQPAQTALDYAIQFYIRGFTRLRATFLNPGSPSTLAATMTPILGTGQQRIKVLIRESLAVLIFWSPIVWLITR